MTTVRYAALLRGINVGGRRIAMADLRDCLTEAGFTDVSTVLASGNVLFRTDTADATTKLENAISARFGFTARAIVVPTAELAHIVAHYPFPERSGWHSYVVFYAGPCDDELSALARLADDLDPAVEQIAVELPGTSPHPQTLGLVFWQVERGHTLDSVIGKRTGKPPTQVLVTNRNLNTLRKLR